MFNSGITEVIIGHIIRFLLENNIRFDFDVYAHLQETIQAAAVKYTFFFIFNSLQFIAHTTTAILSAK